MANNVRESSRIVEISGNFRDYLIPLDHPRLHPSGRGAREHAKSVLGNEGIFLTPVARGWQKNYHSPYQGFTTDGKVVENIWRFDSDANGPTNGMVEAARQVLASATSTELARFKYSIEAREWRAWSNPEVIVIDAGLRIEEMTQELREAVHKLLKISLSTEGYEKVWTAMLMNAFLGELTTLKNVMNTDSYHFCMFGEPADKKPWGFNIYGHHLCLNVFTLDGEVIIGPFFVGAEPNIIDEGPHRGITLLNREEAAGLAFMKSLSLDQQRKATIQGDINDIDGSTMPTGRWNPADLRGLGGAHQDNRIVPFEGLCAAEMSASQKQALVDLVGIFNEILPDGSRQAFKRRVEKYIDVTFFAWIGPVNDTTPFYFRIHSPIVMDEFDHHNGVWLANALPKKYHIHTIQRLPNRGDYGTALYEEWKSKRAEEYPH